MNKMCIKLYLGAEFAVVVEEVVVYFEVVHRNQEASILEAAAAFLAHP